MKNYIGCKIIKAEEKTYGEYKKEKYGDKQFESNIPDNEKGYMVKYPAIGEGSKEHISWSPKNIFEKAYRLIEDEEFDMINS